MKKPITIFIIFSIVIFILLTGSLYNRYNSVIQLKEQIVKDEGKSIVAFITAFRASYQDVFTLNHIQLTDTTLQFLPVKTTNSISEKFSHLTGDKTLIRTVSDRPRNLENLANNNELKIINYFKENKDKEFYFKDNEDTSYFYAQPLYITETCLKCHGKREDAPKIIRDNYSLSYDYKLNDLRGILSIKISKTTIVNTIDTTFYDSIKTAIIMYVLFLIGLYMMIQIILKNEKEYTHTLEDKVAKQVAELDDKQHMLAQQSKMVSMGEMLENIAHQWRQPLSVISTSSTGLLLQKELGISAEKDELEILNKINDTAQHLSQTINDFRDFFKSNKEKSLFDIKKIYLKTSILMSSKLKNKDIQVIENLAEIEVEGIEGEFIQVLMNILNNSQDILETTKDDRKLIFVDIYKDGKDTITTIKDNGGGIPNDIINKVFDPYFTTKHKAQGTGIGLYMSMEIIVKHFGGSLEVHNEEYEYEGEMYKGAKFIIKI